MYPYRAVSFTATAEQAVVCRVHLRLIVTQRSQEISGRNAIGGRIHMDRAGIDANPAFGAGLDLKIRILIKVH